MLQISYKRMWKSNLQNCVRLNVGNLSFVTISARFLDVLAYLDLKLFLAGASTNALGF